MTAVAPTLESWFTDRLGRQRQASPRTIASYRDTLRLLVCFMQARTGRRLSPDAIERRVAIHAAAAAQHCPSLQAKRLHPHVLRHSCAMSLLQARVDVAVIALWLGHADIRSTDAYVHADLTIKERALAMTTPASVKPGRYKPPDPVLAFLESLLLCRPHSQLRPQETRLHRAFRHHRPPVSA